MLIEETVRNLISGRSRFSGVGSEEKQKKVGKDSVQSVQLSLQARKEAPSKESKADPKASKSATAGSGVLRNSAAILNKKNTGLASPEANLTSKHEPLPSTKSVTRSAIT